MLVRRLAVAAAFLLVPVAAGCGSSGGGEPSTAELSAKIKQSDPDMTDEQATCVADALRDNLPASTLRELMDADLDADPDIFDEAALDQTDPQAAGRLLAAMFPCAGLGDFGDLDMGDLDMEGFDGDGQGESPFGG